MTRPDFIDRFYSLVRPIARLTGEIDELGKEGLRLSETGDTAAARRALKRIELLNKQRKAAKRKYESYLKSRKM